MKIFHFNPSSVMKEAILIWQTSIFNTQAKMGLLQPKKTVKFMFKI